MRDPRSHKLANADDHLRMYLIACSALRGVGTGNLMLDLEQGAEIAEYIELLERHIGGLNNVVTEWESREKALSYTNTPRESVPTPKPLALQP